MDIFKLLTSYDKTLIIAIILISIAAIISYPHLIINNNNYAKYTVIKINNQKIARYRLTKQQQIAEFSFKVQEKEYSGQLEIAENKVRLHRLPEKIVPRAIHANMGWIEESYQMIVALPIKLTVEIETEQKNHPAQLDGVVY